MSKGIIYLKVITFNMLASCKSNICSANYVAHTLTTKQDKHVLNWTWTRLSPCNLYQTLHRKRQPEASGNNCGYHQTKETSKPQSNQQQQPTHKHRDIRWFYIMYQRWQTGSFQATTTLQKNYSQDRSEWHMGIDLMAHIPWENNV